MQYHINIGIDVFKIGLQIFIAVINTSDFEVLVKISVI